MTFNNFRKALIIVGLPLALIAFTYILQTPLESNIIMYCLFITFIVHWLIGIPSVIARTEHFFDLTGSLAVLSMLGFLYYTTHTLSSRASILLILCAIWTIRLGSFLFYRIKLQKVDKRFNELKKSYLSFLITWHLSAVWTFLTIICAICAIVSPYQQMLSFVDYILVVFWVMAFLIEFISDFQKLKFKMSKNKLPFITTGLWYYSRHPNYFGEIMMWFFIAGLAVPNLFSWLYLSLVSPIFVAFLLIKVSGINLLEQANDKKYSHIPAYIEYKNSTPILLPKFYK